MIEAFLPILIVESEDDFGIRVGGESVAFFLERRTLLLEIVNLTIENDFIAVEVSHGLMSERGEVDDGESAMSETDLAIRRDVSTSIIRATMLDGIVHGLNLLSGDIF